MPLDSIKAAIQKAPKTILAETNKVGDFVIKKLPFAKEKADEFVKKADPKVGKNTAVGGVVLTAAVVSALACIKMVHKKIKDVNKQ